MILIAKQFIMIELSTGKKIEIKERTGATHMVESRLLAAVTPRGSNKDDIGMNLGDLTAMSDVKAAVSIKAIDERPIKTPNDLMSIYELMGEFSYDEWDEFKNAVTPKDEDEIEKKADSLHNNNGSEYELNLPSAAEQV